MLTQAIVNKMLHGPTAVLKKTAEEKDGYAYVDAARRLYGLDADIEKIRRAHGLRGLLNFGGGKARKDETGETNGC